jgi:hypothetical protein
MPGMRPVGWRRVPSSGIVVRCSDLRLAQAAMGERRADRLLRTALVRSRNLTSAYRRYDNERKAS